MLLVASTTELSVVVTEGLSSLSNSFFRRRRRRRFCFEEYGCDLPLAVESTSSTIRSGSQLDSKGKSRFQSTGRLETTEDASKDTFQSVGACRVRWIVTRSGSGRGNETRCFGLCVSFFFFFFLDLADRRVEKDEGLSIVARGFAPLSIPLWVVQLETILVDAVRIISFRSVLWMQWITRSLALASSGATPQQHSTSSRVHRLCEQTTTVIISFHFFGTSDDHAGAPRTRRPARDLKL